MLSIYKCLLIQSGIIEKLLQFSAIYWRSFTSFGSLFDALANKFFKIQFFIDLKIDLFFHFPRKSVLYFKIKLSIFRNYVLLYLYFIRFYLICRFQIKVLKLNMFHHLIYFYLKLLLIIRFVLYWWTTKLLIENDW